MKARPTIKLGPRALAAATVFAVAAVWGCSDKPQGPVASELESPDFHVVIGPACFRMTGGGRIDEREGAVATPPSKSTPDSRDFATFGFQARPLNCNTTAGSGNITWVEHNPANAGGFTFHGRVTEFFAVENHFFGQPGQTDPICGGFSGTGRARTRDGRTFESLSFRVDHACDQGEPGRNDHIGISISGEGASYSRAGLLTGGNLQKHRLTGRGAQ